MHGHPVYKNEIYETSKLSPFLLNESSCKTFHMKKSLVSMKMRCRWNIFSCEWFHKETCYDTEQKDTTEMAYSLTYMYNIMYITDTVQSLLSLATPASEETTSEVEKEYSWLLLLHFQWIPTYKETHLSFRQFLPKEWSSMHPSGTLLNRHVGWCDKRG